MTDELTALQRANPITPKHLEQAVAMERQTLLEMLDADSGEAPRRLTALRGGSNRPATRAGYVGALAAAAALIVVALLGAEEPVSDQDLVDPAADVAPAAVDGDASGVDANDLNGEADQRAEVVVEVPEEAETETETETEPESEPGLAPEPAAEEPPQSTTTVPESAPVFETAALPDAAPLDPSADVLSLHFDYFHRDDGHAAVASRELTTWFGLTPHVVGGTAASDFDGYIHPFGSVMDTTWGDQWFDARTDRQNTVLATVDRWLSAIDAGGQVWIAEGGVSDFTAEVLRDMIARRPELDTAAVVHVVQHSTSNEVGTVPENLEYVAANTTYLRIEDGNETNGSANLKQTSEQFTAAALAGRHGQSWAAAFDYLAADRLDFSDTVEVLHILGIPLDQVASPDDFAGRFLG